MPHKFPLFPLIVEVTFSRSTLVKLTVTWSNFQAYLRAMGSGLLWKLPHIFDANCVSLQSDGDGNSIALYTSVLRSSYFIFIKNFAITQLTNLWSWWAVKRFQGQVTKVKERVAFYWSLKRLRPSDRLLKHTFYLGSCWKTETTKKTFRSFSALCVDRVKFQGNLCVGVVCALIQYLRQQKQKWLMNWWQTLTFVNCNTSNEHHSIGTICFDWISSEGEKKLDAEELTKEGKYTDSFFKNYTLFTISFT